MPTGDKPVGVRKGPLPHAGGGVHGLPATAGAPGPSDEHMSGGIRSFTLKPLNDTPSLISTGIGAWETTPLAWYPVEESMGGSPATQPGGCHISPVGVAEAAAPAYFNALMNPIVHQMTRNLHTPKFDDTAENWPSFMWDFQEYCQKLSPTQPILDAYKLRLFEDAMPSTIKSELRLMKKSQGGVLTYPEVVAKFEARYGCGGTSKLRKKWLEVTMPTAGKITTRQLREFQVNFLACADEVRDATPQEVRRQLMLKIPPFMKTWVVEMEQKREREKPIVQITFVDGLSEIEIKNLVQGLIGESPEKIANLGRGIYRAQLHNKEAAKRLLALHMRELREFPKPLILQHVEQTLTTLEIFEVLTEKLTGRERVDMHVGLGERQVNETKAKGTPKVKFEKPSPHPEEKKGGNLPGGGVPMSIPAPSHVPFLAGFDRPVTTSGGGRQNSNATPFYPFKSWRDRVNTTRPEYQNASQMSVARPPAYGGGKGGGKGGQNSNWRPPSPPRAQNGASPATSSPGKGGGSSRPNSQ